jgi:GH15 family glucan-1,4-alpha-glucosidase
VRRVRPLHGSPRIRLVVKPRGDWGASTPVRTRGSNHLRFVGTDLTVRLTTDAPITYLLDETVFTLNGPLNLLLGSDESLEGGIEESARYLEEHTARYWRQWTRNLAIPLEWQTAVIRAAITLKMCLFEETGAIVAAMTTSIPEAPGSARNWDYRYCWLRDAFFVVRALNSLSETGTMEDYLRWLRDAVGRARGGHVQPLYGIGLEQDLTERVVEHLGGYRGHRPVRVGNQAAEHFQHDVYGNIVLGAAQSFHDHRLMRRGTREEFELLERIGDRAFAIHDQPDAGMWELRTRARVHTSSVLMNWAACDRLAKIAETFDLAERAAFWRARADLIRAKILQHAWSEERQAYVESFGGRELDASVLLMAEVGMIDPMHPRFVATVAALENTLCDGPYMRRYEAPDDFGLPETSFNICAFWRIDALARVGRRAEAREIFESLLKVRNPLGLLSEDTHPVTGELWGNFPQTYSMVGIINAAVRLSASWDSRI